MTNEEILWKGTPSQVINLKWFVICGLFCWLVFPLFIILWKWLVVRNTAYEITNQRLRMRTGVLNKQTEDLELYRVKDFRVNQPLLLRMFSVGDIILETSDRTDPEIVIRAVPDPEKLKDMIRNNVEILREVKRVREID